MECRAGCGACCIAPSINRPFFGMPAGKPAGVRCVHLNETLGCDLINDPRRPATCSAFQAEVWLCGSDREQALATLSALEADTLLRQ